jgi:acyl-CoA thioester hydrolase
MVGGETGEHTVTVTVEFEDVDSFRIAHHTKLVGYLERARLRLLTSLGLELGAEGLAPVLYELQVRFRKPARLLDRLEVTATVREVEEWKLTLAYRIRRDSELIARASSVIAFAELDSGELRPVPPAMIAALAPGAGPVAEAVSGVNEGRR